MSPRHCPACGGFVDRAGKCGTRRCHNYRGATSRAATPAQEAVGSQRQATAAPSPEAEVEVEALPSRPVTTLTPSTGEPVMESPGLAAWTGAVVEVMREPIPRPDPSGRCAKCHQPEAVGLGLGFHLCRGEIADGVRHFFELITGLVGNF